MCLCTNSALDYDHVGLCINSAVDHDTLHQHTGEGDYTPLGNECTTEWATVVRGDHRQKLNGHEVVNWYQVSLSARILDNHVIGGQRSQLNLTGWRHELQFEEDSSLKTYLLHGVTEGFCILDDVLS